MGGRPRRGTERGGAAPVWREKTVPTSDSGSRKRQQDEAGLGENSEMEDTASSPLKVGTEKTTFGEEAPARKQLILSGMSSEASTQRVPLFLPSMNLCEIGKR
jgi:hypothetical protein